MATTTSHSEKDFFDICLRSWIHVCLLLHLHLHLRVAVNWSRLLITTRSRIIIITSVRIRFFSELDPADITYTFSKIALLSSLVPLLGIINANLPISAPVFQKVFKISSLSTRIKRSNGTASSDNFQRLREDEYGLTDIKGQSIYPIITSKR
jgi:hypothetical protein